MKKFTLLLLLTSIMFGSYAQNKATQFAESFENPDTWSGYTVGTVGFDSGDWEFNSVFPEAAGASQDGSKACRINDDIPNASITSPSVNTVGTVSFYYHKPFGGDGTFSLQKSVGGAPFVELATLDYSAVTTPTLYTFDVNDASNDIRISIVNDDNTAHLTIDLVTVTDFGGAASVETPTFSPSAGTYYASQDVTISTTTAGANIYYTLDGTDPDNSSTLYAGPITIATTTTLKAIAIDPGAVLADSPIKSGTYTITIPVPVATVAELRAGATDGTIYQLNGEALLTFQQSYRKQKFVQDATAGILIDDNSGKITATLNIGDGLTGIIGTLGSYKGMLQFIPKIDPGAASSTGNTITPLLVSAADFNANFENYEGMLVQIDNLTFADAGGTFTNGQVYATTDPNAVGVDFRASFYGVDYIGSTIAAGGRDIVGIANERDFPYLTARNAADIVNHAPVIPLGSTGIMIAGLLMAVVLVVRRGRLF